MSASFGRALLVGVLVSALSGCFIVDQPGQGPISIRRDGDYLEVFLCAEVAYDLVRIYETPTTEYADLSVIWSFRTDEPSMGGVLLSTDPEITPAFPGEERNVLHGVPGGFISVKFGNKSDPLEYVSAGFMLGLNAVPDDGWLSPYGEVRDEPCAGVGS